MKEKIKTGISVLLILILLPYVAAVLRTGSMSGTESPPQEQDLEALVAGRPLPSANPVPPAFLKNRGRRPHAPAELKDLVQTMQRVLGTKVHAIGNENKGRISIDYFSSDDIDRIYQLFDRMR